jgi:hypothetical protein
MICLSTHYHPFLDGVQCTTTHLDLLITRFDVMRGVSVQYVRYFGCLGQAIGLYTVHVSSNNCIIVIKHSIERPNLLFYIQ